MKKIIIILLSFYFIFNLINCSKKSEEEKKVEEAIKAPVEEKYEGKLKLTKIEKGEDSYNITFNDLIEIKNVKIKESEKGEKYIEFPKINGKYKTIYISNKTFLKDLITAIENNQTVQESEKELEITKVDIKKTKWGGGFARVLLDNTLWIESLKIVNSKKKGLWVAPPSEKNEDGEYDILVYIREPLKKEMDEKIIAKFNEAQSAPEDERDRGEERDEY